jgi:DNA-binding CsgD family transcriptional regulator
MKFNTKETNMKRNKKSFGEQIIKPRITETGVGRDYSNGEASPYWEWMEQHGEQNEDGEIMELPTSNPDGMRDTRDEYYQRRIYYQELLMDTYETLSPKEKVVFNLLAQGFKEKDIAEELGINRNTVHMYRRRMKKKLDIVSTNSLNDGI